MFGIIADLISSVLTILFPIFASYKALQSGNVNHLAPWLMYWVVLSILLLAESWSVFIIGWFPFYSWIRLFVLSYLVLPQTQGAKKVYLEYLEPFLRHHEREIEAFISDTHERAKSAGLQHLYQAIDLIRERVFGLPPLWTGQAEEPQAAPSYAQTLFSRFNLPAAPTASSLSGPASDIVSLLGNVLGSAPSTTKNRDVQAEELSASERLLPKDLASAPSAQQAEYITSQMDNLKVLLSAYNRKIGSLGLAPESRERGYNDDLAYGTSYDYESGGLRKNRSDNSFENIEHEDIGVTSSADNYGHHHHHEHRRSKHRH